KTIIPLNNLVDASTWTPSLIKSFSDSQGSFYAVPMYPYVLPFWYNIRMFNQYNIQVPQKWDDLLAACKTLKTAGKIPIALGLTERWELSIYYEYLAAQTAGPGMVAKAAKGQGASFTDQPFVDAAAHVQQLVNSQCFPQGAGSIDQDAMSAQFFTEKAAMV